jgi:hypothetical protein
VRVWMGVSVGVGNRWRALIDSAGCKDFHLLQKPAVCLYERERGL